MIQIPRWGWLALGGGILVLLVRTVARRVAPASVTGALVQGKMTAVSKFGPRGNHYHQGADFFASEGTPVAAAALGTVEMVGPTIGPSLKMFGYGEYIVLRHAGGLRTMYAHLSKGHVRLGQRVSQGEIIGAVGRTAYGDCGTYFCKDTAHLHFEVMPNEGPINKKLTRAEPVAWLKARGIRPAVA